MISRYAIVVIGYNRLNSLMRLCKSLERVDCLGERLDLIISLDFCEDKSIEKFAIDFCWEKGEKRVVTHEERLGLKKHVLSCGKFLDEYEAIAVLEDDLYVSSMLYSYLKQAVEYYKDSDDIAGISLYSYGRNELNGLGFKADYSQYDNFFMQLAQSWGQIWMKRQWKEFMLWYHNNSDNDVFSEINMPKQIKGWDGHSWLKYHMAYCVDQNKYFVYPYMSLTTCYSEAGVHAKFTDITQQVALYEGKEYKYSFADLSDVDAVRYDSFYERMNIEERIADLKKDGKLCVNLYGDKYNFDDYRYLLTMSKYDGLKPLKSYGLIMKPQEMNVILNVDGNDIFLYDITGCYKKMNSEKKDKWKLLEYNTSPKITSDINMVKLYLYKLIRKYFHKIIKNC